MIVVQRIRGVIGDDLFGVARGLSAKVLVGPLVAIAWLAAARVVITSAGVEGYAGYAIVAGIAVLLPFADLGTGVAVMDAMARRDAPGAVSVERVILTSWRILGGASLLLAFLAVALALQGQWSVLFAFPAGQRFDRAVAAAVVVFAAGLPFAVGPRLLIGGGLNHVAVLLQALASGVMLLVVGVGAFIGGSTALFFAAPFVGTATSNLLALVVAGRKFDIRYFPIIISLIRPRGGAKIRHVAGPMFLISLMLPLAYQTDRLVLAHVSTLSEVAEYSLGFQFYSPLLGLVSTAGISLWSVFAQTRVNGKASIAWSAFVRTELAFVLLGSCLVAALLLVAPLASPLVSNGQIRMQTGLLAGFALLLLSHAAIYPMSMILTDATGLRFQAVLHATALSLNLPLSVWWATVWGAAGPVFASAVATLLVLGIPQLLRVRRLAERNEPGVV